MPVNPVMALRRNFTMSGTTGAFVVLVVLLVFYGIIQPSLFSVSQVNSLANEATVVAIAAVGETIVVLTGGFDLSVGSVLSVLNVVLATRIRNDTTSEALMIPLLLVLGAAMGCVNGLLVAVLRVPSIVATLAMGFFWSGVALLILKQPGGSVPTEFVGWFTSNLGGVLPNAFLLLALVILIWLALKRTGLGLSIYAIGGDPVAAAANGIRVNRSLVAAYALSGFFYGLSALFLSAESASGDPNVGIPITLAVFAAAVVGGTPFGGGRGDAIGGIVGAFVLTVIANVLFALGVSSFYTNIFNGAVLLFAVLAGTLVGMVGQARAWLGRSRGGGGSATDKVTAPTGPAQTGP